MSEVKKFQRYGEIRPAQLILDPGLGEDGAVLNQFTSACATSETGVAKVPVWNFIAQAVLELMCLNERDYVTRRDTAQLTNTGATPIRLPPNEQEICDHVYGHLQNLALELTNAELVYEEPIRSILSHLYSLMQPYVPEILNLSMWSLHEIPVQVERFDAHTLQLRFTRPV